MITSTDFKNPWHVVYSRSPVARVLQPSSMEGPHNHGIVASIPILLAISSYDLTCHIMLSDSKVWIPIYWSLPTLAGCPSAYRQFQIPCKNGTQFLLKQFLWHNLWEKMNRIPWNHRLWMMKCTNGLPSWAVVKPPCDSTKYWLIKSGFPSSRIVRIPKIWDGYWYWIVPHWSSTYHHPMILYLRISQYLLIPIGSNSTWSWFSSPRSHHQPTNGSLHSCGKALRS